MFKVLFFQKNSPIYILQDQAGIDFSYAIHPEHFLALVFNNLLKI